MRLLCATQLLVLHHGVLVEDGYRLANLLNLPGKLSHIPMERHDESHVMEHEHSLPAHLLNNDCF